MADIDSVPFLARSIFDTDGSFEHLLTRIGDDDCAILVSPSGCLILTTDLMNYEPALMNLPIPNKFYNYGYLMASSNLSDLYGTGARPLAMLVGLMVPEDMPQDQVAQLLEGVQTCCRQHGIPVVGGDTKRSKRLQG